MTELPDAVLRMIQEIEKLPGIGRKSAERIAYHILKTDKNEALALSDSIRAVKEDVCYCKDCFNLSEEEYCTVCKDESRDRSLLCIVEQPRDLIILEQSGAFRGLYHVLLGRLVPSEGFHPEQLTLSSLFERLGTGQFHEVVMGTNPTSEGDGTALFIANKLKELATKNAAFSGIKLTRLARGITSGSDLQFANKEMLVDALAERQVMR
ncbi:MAG: recombination mediator RecR [Thermoguttaceae bacterium]